MANVNAWKNMIDPYNIIRLWFLNHPPLKGILAKQFKSYVVKSPLNDKEVQSNFSGSITFGTMKISSRQG